MDDGLLKAAQWSDAFFNYVPAEQAWDTEQCAVNQIALGEAADQFLEVNPTCPYGRDWLLTDFLKRL